MPPPYPDQRREALKLLSRLFNNKSHVRVIHYSCESFDSQDQRHSPRITSIAVRRLDLGQVAYFSIHDLAEVGATALQGSLTVAQFFISSGNLVVPRWSDSQGLVAIYTYPAGGRQSPLSLVSANLKV